MKVADQFGHNLAYCRRRAKLSQEELAVRASLHRTAVGQLERGERVARVDTAIKLAGSLGIPPEELLDGMGWDPGGGSGSTRMVGVADGGRHPQAALQRLRRSPGWTLQLQCRLGGVDFLGARGPTSYQDVSPEG